jgi:3'-phosphoadenosine 5'-phosphosulfate sulfotransferase (PAPS reductase)/FAD synthetase
MSNKNDSKYTKDDLKIMQSWPLERKIRVTQLRIMEWYEHWNGQVYVSFSGGKDSTVLLDLARRVQPDIEAVFVDTGLEYPEIKQFVKTKDNVAILRPKMRFDEVIKHYGYPIISKEVSQTIKDGRSAISKGNTESRAIKKLEGRLLDNEGNKSMFNCEKWHYLLDSDIKISHQCCEVMKKRPCHLYEKQSLKKPITGVMASESIQRKVQWIRFGCNAFDSKYPQGRPMSFWTEQDVLRYLHDFSVDYCSVYGDIVEKNGKLYTSKCNRTGCMFCALGCHVEKSPNRFQQLKQTHPRQYEYCIGGGEYEDGIWVPNRKGLGLGHVLDTINVKYD